jgi:hypothetical protein
MSVAILERPVAAYPTFDEHELVPARTQLRSAAPTSLTWCFDCERVFQLGVGRVACPYFDCGTSAVAFWQWDAYTAMTGAAGKPQLGVRYPLHSPAAYTPGPRTGRLT